MASEEVLDAVEDILRQEGVLDEIKKSLFLSVSRVVKKQKPIETVSKVKDFASTLDGKYSLLLVAELLEQLDMKHSVEIFALESGFTANSTIRDGLQEKFGGKLTSSDVPMLHQIVSGAARDVSVGSVAEDKHDEKSSDSPIREENKPVHAKKNRSPLAHHSSPPHRNTALDLESSYDADDKSTSSMDRRHFSPDKKAKKQNSLSPLGPSPPKKSPLVPLADKIGSPPNSGLPPLGSLEPLVTNKRSPLTKISDELSHDSLSSRKRHDHLEDSFEQSLEEKFEESKDGFEISDSFEKSDINLQALDSPLGKHQSHVLAPLHDALSPYSTKSEKEKSYAMDESQPEELASASFLEESEVSEGSNMFDDEDCMILDSPKKSDSNPTQINRVDVKQRELDSDDPATDGQPNVNVSTASTIRMTRSQVGWDNDDDKERPDDDFEYIETGPESKSDDNKDSSTPGRSDFETKSSDEKESKGIVEDYEVNSDFDSIEDMDAYAKDMKYNEDENDLNVSHASYRSNQEEDEEENSRLEASRANEDMDGEQKSASGSLFASPIREEKKEETTESPSPSSKKKSLDDTDDYEDEYGDDFDQDEEEEAEELDESIAESLEEDFDDDDNLSFGSKHDSDDDSDKDKSYMSSPTHSPSEKLPSLFTKSELPKESKMESSFNDSHDSDPFQDKSASFSDDGPETSLASKDDLADFSVGEESSGSDEFLKDEDDNSASASANDLSVKDQKSVGRLADSNEFSMSENEISGSHNLNEFGVDYTTSAAPPAGRRGGW